MMEELKTISVIIPIPALTEHLPVLSYLKNINYPLLDVEIILAVGNHPSLQRNAAAKVAKGQILYFFNWDSCPEKEIFNKAVDIFNKNNLIAGVGGPDITPDDNSYVQKLFGYALGSYFAHGQMRARYMAIGKEREACEKELLLSNMAIRRDIYLKFDGFNERLYPNEENEIINRIINGGYKFVYSPDIKVYRDRRKTLVGFSKQFLIYGRGRMSQIFIEGWLKNIYFFMPVLFFIYLFSLIFLHNFYYLIPLLIYSISAFCSAIGYAINRKDIALIVLLPLAYLTMHIFYGLGMITKSITDILRRNVVVKKQEIVVNKIKELNTLF